MECKICEVVCIKKGFQQNGSQKYYCKHCKKYQQKKYEYKAYEKGIDEKIKRMCKRTGSISDTQYVLQISKGTIIKRIKQMASEIERPKLINGRSYEMDELHLWHYESGQKTAVYLSYAIDRKTKIVSDFVLGGRSSENLEKITQSLIKANAKEIRTDKWPSYPSIIPDKIHETRKHKINIVERNHLTLRIRLKRLGYHSSCWSRSLSMLSAILKIFFWSS